MPVTISHPGVYIEEIPSTVRSIISVGTSTTAFIGSAIKGPVNKPFIVNRFSEYERTFGRLWENSSMSYVVSQFFLNGGSEAVIVRVVPPDAVVAVFENGTSLKFIAANPGTWANNFKVTIDHDVNPDADNSADLFNMVVKEKIGQDSNDNDLFVDVESFRNVSYKDDGRYFLTVLKEESNLAYVDEATLPVLTGRPSAGDFTVSTTQGSDGSNVDGDDIKGEVDTTTGEKSGIYALDKTDIFNILCIPPPDPQNTPNSFYTDVYVTALNYCKDRRAMLIVDPPSNWTKPESPLDSSTGVGSLSLQSENAAIYFPQIKAPDPLSEGRLKSFPPCGVIAGIMSRTDNQRGVWKAPAGLETSLTGVPDLGLILTDEENGRLNQMGVNCLRVLPPAGRVVWGARTMRGADRLADQWKYVPVRRTALFIEESLYRGTQWVVFEPNDEPLWSQIRLNVGAFMHDLFRKGAFQGSTTKEAYLVKCDKDTTTQTDIDRGIVNILVGFAPLKPAEFVIIKIQQLAGQETP